ncbi:hypothetical protein ABK040_005780 [Willaertia magna]
MSKYYYCTVEDNLENKQPEHFYVVPAKDLKNLRLKAHLKGLVLRELEDNIELKIATIKDENAALKEEIDSLQLTTKILIDELKKRKENNSENILPVDELEKIKASVFGNTQNEGSTEEKEDVLKKRKLNV